METNISSLFIRELQKHINIFGKDSNNFVLEINQEKGLGIKAKQELKTHDDIYILDGDCEDTSMSDADWSRVTVNLGSGIGDKEYLLVGPINFVNHGCDEHANCVIKGDDDEISDDLKMTHYLNLRTNEDGTLRKIDEGDELLCDYGEKYDSITCAVCGK